MGRRVHLEKLLLNVFGELRYLTQLINLILFGEVGYLMRIYFDIVRVYGT